MLATVLERSALQVVESHAVSVLPEIANISCEYDGAYPIALTGIDPPVCHEN